MSLPDEARPSGNLRFLGDVLANTLSSAGAPILSVAVLVKEFGCSRSPSTARSQSADDADSAIGEGSGVISASGPTPGEEIAELGEREFTLDREGALENAEPTLELRTGRPAFSRICWSSKRENGALEAISLLDGSTGAVLIFDCRLAL